MCCKEDGLIVIELDVFDMLEKEREMGGNGRMLQ